MCAQPAFPGKSRSSGSWRSTGRWPDSHDAGPRLRARDHSAPCGTRARLVNRHARRRAGPRGDLRAVSRRHALRAAARPGLGVRDDRGPPDTHVVHPVGAVVASSLPPVAPAVSGGHRTVRPRRLRSDHQHESLRCQVGRATRPHPAPVLLLHPDALRLGPVRRLFRTEPGGRRRHPDVPMGPERDGPMGRRHGRAGQPLCRHLPVCCGENTPIL